MTHDMIGGSCGCGQPVGHGGECIPVMCAEIEKLTAERDEARSALLNSKGDDLCWFDPASPQIPPKDEFLKSCERFHAQISATNGVLTGCKTIAQLEVRHHKDAFIIQSLREALDTACGALSHSSAPLEPKP